MNILLKFIFTLLTISIVVITNNRIILWLFLLLLTFYNLYKYKKISLFVCFILIPLLGFSKDNEIFLLIFKLIFIVNFLLTIYNNLTDDDKRLLVKEKRTTKLDFFENNFERIVKNIKEKKQELYDEDVSIDDRIENDLERQYLQARIRYYNYNSKKKWYNWNRIDTLVLLLLLIVFVILFILR